MRIRNHPKGNRRRRSLFFGSRVESPETPVCPPHGFYSGCPERSSFLSGAIRYTRDRLMRQRSAARFDMHRFLLYYSAAASYSNTIMAAGYIVQVTGTDTTHSTGRLRRNETWNVQQAVDTYYCAQAGKNDERRGARILRSAAYPQYAVMTPACACPHADRRDARHGGSRFSTACQGSRILRISDKVRITKSGCGSKIRGIASAPLVRNAVREPASRPAIMSKR